MSSKRILQLLPPEQIVLLSIVLTIGIGTLLLGLPIAQLHPIPFLDTLFTATSVTCVTGLFTVPIDHYTLFGKMVIMILIQIGGLGLITLTIFFLSTVTSLGLGTQLMAGHILEIDSWRQLKRVLYLIMFVTISSEFVGALLIFSVISNYYTVKMAWFYSFFQSISSFCSAGILPVIGGIKGFNQSNLLIGTCAALMYIGELGFITWQEIGRYIKARYFKRPYRFSLHSKIIIYYSTALLFITGIIFWILEHKNVLTLKSFPQSAFDTIFYVISLRSTGLLLNVSIMDFHLATLLLIMVIAFIGSAPGSTGSGIKISTFAVFFSTVKAAVSGKTSVIIFGRTIALSQIYRTLGIVTIGLSWIMGTTFCLLITEPTFGFLELLFESVNAFTSVGISMHVTPKLSVLGKSFLIVSMLIGRIGSFSLILALKLRRQKSEPEITYPEERVMLG